MHWSKNSSSGTKQNTTHAWFWFMYNHFFYKIYILYLFFSSVNYWLVLLLPPRLIFVLFSSKLCSLHFFSVWSSWRTCTGLSLVFLGGVVLILRRLSVVVALCTALVLPASLSNVLPFVLRRHNTIYPLLASVIFFYETCILFGLRCCCCYALHAAALHAIVYLSSWGLKIITSGHAQHTQLVPIITI